MFDQPKKILSCATAVVLMAVAGCTVPPPQEREISVGHLATQPAEPRPEAEIPETVRRRAFVPLPEPTPPSETYTVVVNEVPVKELLFALARDAALNIDVHPNIDGQVTLNAVDQTLTQILDRIGRQVDLRYENRAGTLLILPDTAFLRTYQLDYVNVSRDTTSDSQTSTEVATVAGAGGGGGEGNASTTQVNNVSNNRIWETVIIALREIVSPNPNLGIEDPRETVIANPESGVIVIRATASQHALVQAYLDKVTVNLHRQVLIESTIVEVELSDQYQSGIDFSRFLGANISGLAFSNVTTAAFAAAASGVSGLLVQVADQAGTVDQDINIIVRLLKEFGDTRVLSSPKLMTLNNQTALLKVVDNEVYFTVEVTEEEDADTGDIRQDITSNVNTVPVGLVMNVTPQISASRHGDPQRASRHHAHPRVRQRPGGCYRRRAIRRVGRGQHHQPRAGGPGARDGDDAAHQERPDRDPRRPDAGPPQPAG